MPTNRYALFCLITMTALLCSSCPGATYVLSLTKPSGGEAFAPGQTQSVIIEKRYQPAIAQVELSTDGGATFTVLGQILKADPEKSKRQRLDWVVPNSPSGNCVIRVSGQLSTIHTSVGVSGAFSILAGDSVSGSGISHGALTNLDADDHLQYLNRSGVRSMTGALTLSGDPTANLHSATKQYVDSGDAAKVAKAGDAMTGALTLSGDPTANLHSATKQYVDGAANGKVSKSGDTMTGALLVNLTDNNRAVSGITTGAGNAGYFQINNASSGAAAVSATTNGPGRCVNAVATGPDNAGFFEINNASSGAAALSAATNGSGPGVNAVATGTGNVALFQISNPANVNAGLVSITNGSGDAAHFRNTNSTNSAPAIFAQNAGSYATVVLRHDHASGDFILMQAGNPAPSYADVARIDRDGNAYFTSVTQTSDRDAKRDFVPTDSEAILGKLASIQILEWNFKHDDPSIRHMGPTAQDFHGAFGLGSTNKGISTVDADGVCMAAIKALEARTRALAEENKRLRDRLEKLEQLLAGE